MGDRARAAALTLIGALLVLTACGGPSDGESADEEPTAPPTDPPATDPTAEGPAPDDEGDGEPEAGADAEDDDGGGDEADTADPSPTEAFPSQPEGVEPAEDSDLPGQSVLTYFSRTGAEAQVIRVGHEDQLNVRSLPGATEDPITTLRPDGEVELAGRERLLGSNSWAEIALDEGVGWVNTYYLGYLGEAEDVTEDYSDLGPASVPRAAVDMVTSRAAAAARDETRYAYSDLTGAPPEDGLEAREQEWTVDLTTPGDDAVLGDRLSVRLEREDDTYGITDVERTPICLRGASDGGCL